MTNLDLFKKLVTLETFYQEAKTSKDPGKMSLWDDHLLEQHLHLLYLVTQLEISNLGSQELLGQVADLEAYIKDIDPEEPLCDTALELITRIEKM